MTLKSVKSVLEFKRFTNNQYLANIIKTSRQLSQDKTIKNIFMTIEMEGNEIIFLSQTLTEVDFIKLMGILEMGKQHCLDAFVYEDLDDEI